MMIPMNSSIDIWKNCLTEARETLDQFTAQPEIWESLERLSQTLISTFENGGTVFSCGNGGSHCDAMHFAEEWTGRYRKDRKPMGALALGDPSHVTCVSNDFGFEHVFERQIQALARKGDCLLLLSTSGNSKNQILAVEAAKSKGLKTIGLLGRDGGKLKNLVDVAIVVPAKTSDRIQEMHIKIIHTVIEVVERKLFPELY
jgi:D-sedoheptulose 7-phosphate isomerase